MTLAILSDASYRPELFFWSGPIDEKSLDSWLNQRSWKIPEDLKFFWKVTGGGDFFESETIYGPFSDLWTKDFIDEVNRHQKTIGLPSKFLVFHSGIQYSAIDLNTQTYLFLNEKNFEVLREFPSLETWYTQGIRPIFKEKYGLIVLNS
jgi:hypothetical protein